MFYIDIPHFTSLVKELTRLFPGPSRKDYSAAVPTRRERVGILPISNALFYAYDVIMQAKNYETRDL